MEVLIERILPGGVGLAHADGKTIMVPLSAPGDRLRVQIEREKGGVAFAAIVEVLEPSRDRVEPPCPYFGRCGGCNFQQLSYDAQLNAKIEIIKDCFHRIAHVEHVPDFEIVAAPNPWHYRARAQWQYDAPQKRFGYFESGSRRVCDVAECAVLVPELQQSLEGLRRRMHEGSLPTDARYFRAIAGDDGISAASNLGIAKEIAASEVTRTISGVTYQLNAESFFQTNMDLAPALINLALANASGETAVELYCGVGLFTVPLARRFKEVIAVEGNAACADFAERNLANAGLTNAKFIRSDAGTWLDAARLPEQSKERHQAAALQNKPSDPPVVDSPDLLLLDPPRTGAESRVISGILELRPKRICYVSCDPATLARDLKKLIAREYSLDSVVAFDMFPQTHHVETVVHLSG